MMAGDDKRDDTGSLRPELSPGEAAGQHVITGFIARGGGGSVYRARHRDTGQPAAVKVLHRSLAALPKMVERFRREVDALNRLRHPGIVEISEVGALDDGRPFYAMELLGGRTVATLIAAEGRLPPRDAVEIFEAVCEALAAAHAAGVVHRDVKPSNIIVEEERPRRIKLLDFGVAKLHEPAGGGSDLTSKGRQIGTPTSMAPEQILGGMVDERTDVYALGVLLYVMLTGKPPFGARSALTIMRDHLEQPAPRPSARVPEAAPLDAVTLRCMEKHPAYRYESVGALLSALHEAKAVLLSTMDADPAELLAREDRRSPEPDLAAALYVEVRVQSDGDEITFSEHIGAMLDVAEDAMRVNEFIVVSATGNQVLGVLPLQADAGARAQRLARVLEIAAALRQQLDALERPLGRVHANLCVHVAGALLRDTNKLEVIGGPIVRTDLWAPGADVPGVYATGAVGAHLDK